MPDCSVHSRWWHVRCGHWGERGAVRSASGGGRSLAGRQVGSWRGLFVSQVEGSGGVIRSVLCGAESEKNKLG